MGLAKGRQEGFGYKSWALKLRPGLVCRRETGPCDIVGYVVYDGEKAVASAGSASNAWFKAWMRVRKKKEKGR